MYIQICTYIHMYICTYVYIHMCTHTNFHNTHPNTLAGQESYGACAKGVVSKFGWRVVSASRICLWGIFTSRCDTVHTFSLFTHSHCSHILITPLSRLRHVCCVMIYPQQVIFRKSDLYLVALLWKMICNLGDPMSLGLSWEIVSASRRWLEGIVTSRCDTIHTFS